MYIIPGFESGRSSSEFHKFNYRGIHVIKYLDGLFLDPSFLSEIKCNKCRRENLYFLTPYD